MNDLTNKTTEELLELISKIFDSEDGCYNGLYYTNVLPYLPQEEIVKIVQERIEQNKNVAHIIPFIKKDNLSIFVDKYIFNPNFNFYIFLPFISQDDLKKLLEASKNKLIPITKDEISIFIFKRK